MVTKCQVYLLITRTSHRVMVVHLPSHLSARFHSPPACGRLREMCHFEGLSIWRHMSFLSWDFKWLFLYEDVGDKSSVLWLFVTRPMQSVQRGEVSWCDYWCRAACDAVRLDKKDTLSPSSRDVNNGLYSAWKSKVTSSARKNTSTGGGTSCPPVRDIRLPWWNIAGVDTWFNSTKITQSKGSTVSSISKCMVIIKAAARISYKL